MNATDRMAFRVSAISDPLFPENFGVAVGELIKSMQISFYEVINAQLEILRPTIRRQFLSYPRWDNQ